MRTLCWGFAGCLWLLGSLSAEERPSGADFYRERVRPILVERCFKCHSRDCDSPAGGLLVDSRDDLLSGGDQGPAIVPGEPDDSLLLQALRYELDDLKMPPDRRLEDREIADLAEWIQRGAPMP